MQTLELALNRFGKHHKGYVDKLNAELAKPENQAYAAAAIVGLDALVKKTAGHQRASAVFNAAAWEFAEANMDRLAAAKPGRR